MAVQVSIEIAESVVANQLQLSLELRLCRVDEPLLGTGSSLAPEPDRQPQCELDLCREFIRGQTTLDLVARPPFETRVLAPEGITGGGGAPSGAFSGTSLSSGFLGGRSR